MTGGDIRAGRIMADTRLSIRVERTRMSYTDLATAFHASGMCPEVPKDIYERARLVAIPDPGLIFASTFADTVAINRAFIDLYEEDAQVRRIA